MIDLESLRTLRAERPEHVASILADRPRRPLLQGDKRLLIVAADHPARGAMSVSGHAHVMGDREDLLMRLADALSNPGVDGVLATPDIVDDLAVLGLLDHRIVVGSLNRGGLQGSTFELDDRRTAYTIDRLVASRLDMAKALVRIDLDDAGTLATLQQIADAVDAASAASLPFMLEPFLSTRRNGRVTNLLDAESVIRSIAITAGLGSSSAYTWMKLPVVDDMPRVLRSTTMPVLLLGGEPLTKIDDAFASWKAPLALPGVRGLVVGRTLLYPPQGTVAEAIDRAVDLVHGGHA